MNTVGIQRTNTARLHTVSFDLGYILQCYLATQENDKNQFIIKYSQLSEVFVATIIGADTLKSNNTYKFLSVKLKKYLSVAMILASLIASFVDLFDYVDFISASGTYIVLSSLSFHHVMFTWFYSKSP